MSTSDKRIRVYVVPAGVIDLDWISVMPRFHLNSSGVFCFQSNVDITCTVQLQDGG